MLEVRVRKPRGCRREPFFQRSSLSGIKITSGLDFFLFWAVGLSVWADIYMGTSEALSAALGTQQWLGHRTAQSLKGQVRGTAPIHF